MAALALSSPLLVIVAVEPWISAAEIFPVALLVIVALSAVPMTADPVSTVPLLFRDLVM